MDINTIKNCHVCHGNNLITTHFRIEDLFGDGEERTVRLCKDCDTIHYIEYGRVSYEFSPSIHKSISKIKIEKDE